MESNSNLKLTYMQNESKGVYVQMPKPDNDEAVKLLAELVKAIDVDDLTDFDYNALIAAKEYLEGNGILSEATV